MTKPRREVYKGVLLPDTVRQCRDLLKRQIDKLEVKVARPGEQVVSPTLTEQMLRVPKVEGQG